MQNDDILNILNNILNIQNVTQDKIPNIDLYTDQVTTFIEENLKDFKRNDEQKIITKTMINNYTKDKILPPSTKKKYNKEHILFLILIYNLKSILSINDIRLLLKDEQQNIKTIYDKFLDYQTITNENLLNSTNSLLKNINIADKKDLIAFLICLIDETNKRKLLTEKIIDLYFKN